jgi:hypothetical protein
MDRFAIAFFVGLLSLEPQVLAQDKVPNSAHWEFNAPCRGMDLVNQWKINGAYPMSSWFVSPWLDQTISIYAYELIKLSGGPHQWLMVGTNGFTADGMLWMSSNESRVYRSYPPGIAAQMPPKSRASPRTLIAIHGFCEGDPIKLILTVYYTIEEEDHRRIGD